MSLAPPSSDRFDARRVEKPWGHEWIWAQAERYVGKVLHVRAGESLSLQYHRVKDETLAVLSGRVRLEWGREGEPLARETLGPGDCVRLRPLTRHRLEALEDSQVLEASTPEIDDVVRLDDRYGRA